MGIISENTQVFCPQEFQSFDRCLKPAVPSRFTLSGPALDGQVKRRPVGSGYPIRTNGYLILVGADVRFDV